MRLVYALFCGAFFLVGCRSGSPKVAGTPPSPGATTNQFPVVTPLTALSGKVVHVNDIARFVILDFGLGRMPLVDQRLPLYRKGLKVGELKITGPQRDNNIVADIVEGEARVGDEAREN